MLHRNLFLLFFIFQAKTSKNLIKEHDDSNDTVVYHKSFDRSKTIIAIGEESYNGKDRKDHNHSFDNLSIQKLSEIVFIEGLEDRVYDTLKSMLRMRDQKNISP